jgi:hypothetical protein
MKNHLHFFLIAWLISFTLPAQSMEIGVQGDALIMSGPVVDGDLATVKKIIEANTAIKTAILRNSFGGHVATGYAVGELFREKGFTTVTSGYCISSCSRMFLGGVVRQFATNVGNDAAYVGFHGHYDRNGNLLREMVDQRGLLDWIIKYTDGKANRDLVKQWIYLPRNTDIYAFFHPTTPFSDQKTVRNCERYTRANGAPLRCPSIDTDAIIEGVITTTDRFDISPLKL